MIFVQLIHRPMQVKKSAVEIHKHCLTWYFLSALQSREACAFSVGERRADGGSIPEELRVRFLGPFVLQMNRFLLRNRDSKFWRLRNPPSSSGNSRKENKKRLEETGDIPPHSHLVGHYELELRL